MEQIQISIDGREVSVPRTATVLEAADALGIELPTLCHRPELPPFTSCMVCAVHDLDSGAMIPACSTRVAKGMRLATGDEETLAFRRDALELLFSEHAGDCKAPCRLVCPLEFDAPAFLRYSGEREWGAAADLLEAGLPLPRTVVALCPAPCEKACRRGRHDTAVAIGAMERLVAGQLSGADPVDAVSDVKAVVVGAGPAGLAAAWKLRAFGFAVFVLERASAVGGSLLECVRDGSLPASDLSSDITALRLRGIQFRCDTTVTEADLSCLAETAAIVVVATGAESELGAVEPSSGVVLCGDIVKRNRSPVHAMGSGLRAAREAAALCGHVERGVRERLHCTLGTLVEDELAEFLAGASSAPRAAGELSPSSGEEEARRCLRCDCRSAVDCRLRTLGEEYGAGNRRFPGGERLGVRIVREHPDLVFEAGKCIRCGICVRICQAADNEPGLDFLGRGFNVAVGPPIGASLAEALQKNAAACIAACPTGALCWKDDKKNSEKK
ncbi:MAG: (2Fe-2S)-binding protein [Lentisphaeria bacterium]|nr:(2Fe-2S)-binding protein [Lentisphaeria bacterium]